MWPRLASLVRDRLLLARLAGAAVWLAWLISLAVGGWRHSTGGKRLGTDHVQYYVVGQLVNEGTARLVYDEDTMRQRQEIVADSPTWAGYLPFRYPPFYALVYAPTSRLSYEASYVIWTAIGLTCLVASGLLLGVGWKQWLIGALCFYPVFAAVSFGQNSLLSLVILSAAAALWLRDRPLLAGLVLGLLAYKPHLAIGVGVLWILDLPRSWRALVGIVITTIVLLLVARLMVPDALSEFLTSLGGNVAAQQADREGLAPLYSSQGFWQLLLTAQLDAITNPLALVTSIIGLMVFVGLWWKWRGNRAALYGIAVLVTPWLTPYLMVYDWTILLIPAVLLACHLDADRWLVLAALLWLAALVTGPAVLGQLRISPVALQLSMPALIVAVLAIMPARQPAS